MSSSCSLLTRGSANVECVTVMQGVSPCSCMVKKNLMNLPLNGFAKRYASSPWNTGLYLFAQHMSVHLVDDSNLHEALGQGLPAQGRILPKLF